MVINMASGTVLRTSQGAQKKLVEVLFNLKTDLFK